MCYTGKCPNEFTQGECVGECMGGKCPPGFWGIDGDEPEIDEGAPEDDG